MIGISAYSSDEEQQVAPAVAPAPKAVTVPRTEAKAKPAKKEAPKAKLPVRKLQEILKEVVGAKSATAVVHVARQFVNEFLDLRWSAEALYQVARRSTARTRKEWAKDAMIIKIAESLKKEAASEEPLKGRASEIEQILLGLEALRRMGLQGAQEQGPALARIIKAVAADNWQQPGNTLSRLAWLAAPCKLEGLDELPQELRERVATLDSTGLALLVQAMRHKGARDAALLQKVVTRLKGERVQESGVTDRSTGTHTDGSRSVHAGLSATDLVEMAEGLCELGAHDEGALRPLGVEVLRRRAELTPDESHRVHAVYTTMKLPLPQVWTKPGSAQKRDGSEIVTTTTFIPQDGHVKKRRGNQDLERVSPPRVVRDYKMCSY